MKISIVQGDITEIEADAIVNAANSSLLGGGGVDGAIHKKAGIELHNECKEIRKDYPVGVPKGRAVITKGYKLQAKYVIHTVGPVYKKDDINLLKDCYINSLNLADEHMCKKIAIPAISTGVYGVPIELSAQIVKEVLSTYSSSIIEEIILVLYDDDSYNIYKKIFS